jgi:hypothetical protein
MDDDDKIFHVCFWSRALGSGVSLLPTLTLYIWDGVGIDL